ncbi:MAG: Linear gramicidin synthase subunit D [Chroococcidiopsis cubana SAG 39.79]|nr:Linear gramicidin synthase subunit D [Chroococcidiopsis cubana SAG 39.79]
MKIPVQVINDSDINWEDEYDLTGWETQQQEAKVDEIFQDMLQLPFDYEKGQNLRIAFITLSALKYILLLSLPALCADSGTLNNLVREISISYAACFHQELSDEILQYADIAEWQNELLESEDTETGREYWRKQDIAHLLNLSLPLENQSQANRGFKPQVVGLQINHDLNQKLKF